MTTSDSVRIFPLGDSALTIEFGNAISEGLNDKAIALASAITSCPFEGFVEAVPAYASTTVYYDLLTVRKAFPAFPTAFEAIRDFVSEKLTHLEVNGSRNGREIVIPAVFDPGSAPDLALVANLAGVPESEVIEIFLARSYRVYMLGFLPGFGYMGDVDERIAIPRKGTPRTSVPAGSIGIAGTQTGIYSLESPGGWQIIGRTGLQLFDLNSDEPCYLRAGDNVRFVRAE